MKELDPSLGPTLICDAEVWAPEPLGRRFLLLGGGRILRVLEDRPVFPSGLDVEVVELGGLRLVPGLIDGHAHLTGGGGEAGYGSSVPPVPVERFLAAGVTTAVGVLGTDDLVRTTGQLVQAAYGLRAHGLSAYCHTGGYHLPPTTLTGSVRGDIVHLDPVIGVGEVAISDHRSSQPNLDELLRLGSEAHVAGLMTGKAGIVHLHLGDGARGLDLVRRALEVAEIPARVWNPTHVNRRAALFDEALELVGRGVVIDLTASPEEGLPDVAGPDDEIPASDAVARILGAGLPAGAWTVSSDAGGCLPVFDAGGRVSRFEVGTSECLVALLDRLLRAGHPLDLVVAGMTCNPAALLRLERKGRIAAGADADLLVLDEENRVRDVWARGRPRVREGRLLGPSSLA